MAIALKGDFIGFSFNGYRSEDLGIVRVSDGSRYNEDLVPTAQDKTVQVPGGDGFYYFGSDYTQREFSINIAFDELTEKQFRELQQVFGTKELGKLIFDERPYKYYMVKSGKPQLKYICFGKDGEARIYKGEGTLTFTAYYPYAKSVHKFLSEFKDDIFKNKNEWKSSINLLESKGNYDTAISDKTKPTAYTINLYNPGDLETDFILRFNFKGDQIGGFDLKLQKDNTNYGELAFSTITKFSKDNAFQINTKTNLIEGLSGNDKDGYKLTGTLYNKYVKLGDFFKIPTGDGYTLNVNYIENASAVVAPTIEYDYIYY